MAWGAVRQEWKGSRRLGKLGQSWIVKAGTAGSVRNGRERTELTRIGPDRKGMEMPELHGSQGPAQTDVDRQEW